jgi:hypothetical protein
LPLAGRWLPRLPACGWLLLRYASERCGQRPFGLVDPRPQEPPVTLGCQRLVLGVDGCEQLLEQVADLSGPGPSAIVGCALGQEVPPVDEVGHGGPQWWPRQGPLARSLGGQDRWQLCAGGGAGVGLQRSGLGVPGATSKAASRRSAPQPGRSARSSQGVPTPRTRRTPACQQPTVSASRLGGRASAKVTGAVVEEVGRSAEVGSGSRLACPRWSGSVASARWSSSSATRSRSVLGGCRRKWRRSRILASRIAREYAPPGGSGCSRRRARQCVRS